MNPNNVVMLAEQPAGSGLVITMVALNSDAPVLVNWILIRAILQISAEVYPLARKPTIVLIIL